MNSIANLNFKIKFVFFYTCGSYKQYHGPSKEGQSQLRSKLTLICHGTVTIIIIITIKDLN